jgi:phage baseplate assembly protein W
VALENPHFAFPFELVNGKPRELEQDTLAQVESCELVIIYSPSGYRPERPDFGWQFPEFRQIPLDLTGLKNALEEFEPRGDADVVRWADEAEIAVEHGLVTIEVNTDG